MPLIQSVSSFKLIVVASVIAIAGEECSPKNATPMPSDSQVEASGSIVRTSEMSVARMAHTATTLPNGLVLVAGGFSDTAAAQKSAELYHPSDGRFSPLPRMITPRHSHTAMLLPDGKVLIVGGHRDRQANITIYASTEIYDPATGPFRVGAAMQVRRHKHDALLLHDGRVMVVGGADERDNSGINRSTELYDPKTKAFAMVPSNEELTGQFSASALLGDGTVLITGGYGNGTTGPTVKAWVYRP